MKFKGLVFVIAAVWLLLLVSDIGAFANSVDDGKACQPDKLGLAYQKLPAPYAPTTSTEIVHTKIGGQDFYIPQNYFRHPPIGCGVEEPGMLLRVLLPDLKPYSEGTAQEFAAQRGHDRQMNILVLRESERLPLNKLLETFLDKGTAGPPSAETFGLSNGRYLGKDDLYFARSGEVVEAVILCWKVKPDQSASCDHYFNFGIHNVQLTYGRKYLGEWKKSQQSVTQLIDSFTTRSAN